MQADLSAIELEGREAQYREMFIDVALGIEQLCRGREAQYRTIFLTAIPRYTQNRVGN